MTTVPIVASSEEELEMAQVVAAANAMGSPDDRANPAENEHLHPDHPHHHHHHGKQRRSGRGSFRSAEFSMEDQMEMKMEAAAAAAEYHDEQQHPHHHHGKQRRSGQGSFRSTEFSVEDVDAAAAATAAAAAATAKEIEMSTVVHDVTELEDTSPKKEMEADVASTTSSESTTDAWSTVKETLANWLATTVIGILVVGYWRGTWTLLDIWTCDQPATSSLIGGDVFCFAYDFRDTDRISSGIITYVISLFVLALGVGMVWAGLWQPTPSVQDVQLANKTTTGGQVSYLRAMLRCLICYTLGFGTVLQWHGVWYIIDYIFIPQNMAQSFGWGTFVGVFGCFFLSAGNSMLAPPVIILRDGPSSDNKPPPIAVTMLGSYYALSLPENEPAPPVPLALDIFVSFFVVPFSVLMYWSSFWQLQDLYFYGFTPEIKDVYISVLYSAIIAMFCMVVGSDDIFYFVRIQSKIGKEIMSRIRTLILAIGVLSFWRVVWYIWDLLLGGTTTWSCWLSHWIGVIGLTLMGCLSCITAPPSTLGVDVIPHPDAAKEPLFHYLPVPADSLYFLGIGRQPIAVDVTVASSASGKTMKVIPEADDENSVDL